MTLPEAAQAYADFHMPVFPCVPGDTVPLTAAGVPAATCNCEDVRKLWEQWPDANIGIPTGHSWGTLIVSVANDAGKKSLQELEAACGPFHTWRISTSGRLFVAFSLPFDHPPIPSRTEFLRGVDILAHGGHIVAPPSVVAGEVYRWDASENYLATVPDSLIRMLLILEAHALGIDAKYRFQLEDLRLPNDIKALIRNGTPKGKRSEAVFEAICGFLRNGYVEKTILSILMNPAYSLSEKTLEMGLGWLLVQLQCARNSSEVREAPLYRDPMMDKLVASLYGNVLATMDLPELPMSQTPLSDED